MDRDLHSFRESQSIYWGPKAQLGVVEEGSVLGRESDEVERNERYRESGISGVSGAVLPRSREMGSWIDDQEMRVLESGVQSGKGDI